MADGVESRRNSNNKEQACGRQVNPRISEIFGVFALDSPTRPNPIGLTLVRVLRPDEARSSCARLDFFDGTPILDIKTYRSQYRTDEFTVPEWFRKLADPTGHV